MMTKTENKTVQDLATEANDALETKTRDNGDKFHAFKRHSPQWMQDMAHEAHGDMSPDDWKYEFIHDAIYALSEEDDAVQARDTLEVSCYYSDQLRWLSSNLGRSDYADQAREEFDMGEEPIMKQIEMGMYQEQIEVFELVLGFLAKKEAE